MEKISFISRDTTDRRAFGYIVEGEKGQFHFFGLKTGNAAEGLVLALRDLFQVVYDIKQKEKNGGDAQQTQAMENLQQVHAKLYMFCNDWYRKISSTSSETLKQ